MSRTHKRRPKTTGNNIVHLALVAFSMLSQYVWIVLLGLSLAGKYVWIQAAGALLSLIMVLAIYNKRKNAAIKMPWIIVILAAPYLGIPLYLVFGLSGWTTKLRKQYARIDKEVKALLPENIPTLDHLQAVDPAAAGTFHYLQSHCGFPSYENSNVHYYSNPCDTLEDMLTDLAKAEKYICLEYFAIEDRTAFGRIKDVLQERAANGVLVRIFYDEVGSVSFINKGFIEEMELLGFECRVFNPTVPMLKVFLNNRDHRKIMVIDGKIAYTGGFNLADEYFNITHPYGHWKDSGLRIEGDAVQTFTALCLEMWNASEASDLTDMKPYFQSVPKITRSILSDALPATGVLCPYGDSPLDEENTGEIVYMNLLNYAKKYAWFSTPYLIITDELLNSFVLAAKRGVDVRIITPRIPDKKLIFGVTRSYYGPLVSAGIHIYEYVPGFIHAKQCVVDDTIAACGTINLDYRSLYHHFEDGVLLYGNDAVRDIREDFSNLFPLCEDVTEEYTGKGAAMRLGQSVLRIFAPLL